MPRRHASFSTSHGPRSTAKFSHTGPEGVEERVEVAEERVRPDELVV